MFAHPRLKYLRDFVGMVERMPDTFPLAEGDDTISMPVPSGPDATRGYVRALAELRSGSDIVGFGGKPILSVLSIETTHNDEVMRNSDKQTVKLTQLRLVDGDGEQIHARLAINLTETGRCLKRGDKIRLDSHTELRFRVNDKSPRMPALFIHGLSRVGNAPLLDGNIATDPLPVSRILPTEHNDQFEISNHRIIDPRKDKKPECTDTNRCCAVYGIRFIGCVCDVLPVGERKLATIKEDCYFATDDLKDMTNSHKRNMLYWWYATNVFSISGKGKRGKLPECLEYAIRSAYTEPDGVEFTGYYKKK